MGGIDEPGPAGGVRSVGGVTAGARMRPSTTGVRYRISGEVGWGGADGKGATAVWRAIQLLYGQEHAGQILPCASVRMTGRRVSRKSATAHWEDRTGRCRSLFHTVNHSHCMPPISMPELSLLGFFHHCDRNR